MKYIDTEKLKELIYEKIKILFDKNVKVGGGKWDAEIFTYLSVLNLIDSLQQEQPKVDLEEDVDRILEENDWDYDEIDFYKFAKYFYERGLNTRKE